MNIKIPAGMAEAILAQVPQEEWSQGFINLNKSKSYYGNNRPDSIIEVPIGSFTRKDLDHMYTVAQAETDRSMMMLLSSVRNIMDNPVKSKIGSLTALATGLVDYIKKDAINGWLYTKHTDGSFLPWAVTKIEFHEGDKRDKVPASVVISLTANSVPGMPGNSGSSRESYSATTTNISIYDEDTTRKTIPELLQEKGWFKETETLRNEYLESLELFKQHVGQFSRQYHVSGKVRLAQERWHESWVDLAKPVKAVQDEELLKRRFSANSNSQFWRKNGVDEGFDEMPCHPFILFFHLDLHAHMYAHVRNITPYVYDKSLRDKIILPQEHADLIDILTQDMDVLVEDIIEGKSGGTTILCKGSPGLGKTLTAEVYSEVIERPLYRVHSGQLGVCSQSVEEQLGKVLARAQRWGAALLIDEADVYIRKRGNDIDHNAVVASFLRTLEYFSGLLFMTTNRSDDVDDAIASRCIAVIEYHVPGASEAARIWRVMSNQFEAGLSDSLIEELVTQFPNASGRDIKNLLKLTSKFCRRREIEFSIQAFISCAQFRGLK